MGAKVKKDLKADQGKPDYTVLPPEALRCLPIDPPVSAVLDLFLARDYSSALRLLCVTHYRLLPQMAAVCEYGNQKYAVDNWRADLGTDAFEKRYRAAFLRHMLAHAVGPASDDEESMLPHLAHAGVNLMFLECNRNAQADGKQQST